MKKAILCLVIIMAIYVVLPVIAAESQNDIIAPLNKEGMESPVTSYGQIENILISIIKWFYTLVFVVAVLFILIAAYNFITSGGDEKKVTTAKAYLKWAIIGIAIALVSAGAATLVKNVLSPGNSDGSGNDSGYCSFPCPGSDPSDEQICSAPIGSNQCP